MKKVLYIQDLPLGAEAHGPGPVGSFLRRQRLGKSFDNSISPLVWTRRNREGFVERARRKVRAPDGAEGGRNLVDRILERPTSSRRVPRTLLTLLV